MILDFKTNHHDINLAVYDIEHSNLYIDEESNVDILHVDIEWSINIVATTSRISSFIITINKVVIEFGREELTELKPFTPDQITPVYEILQEEATEIIHVDSTSDWTYDYSELENQDFSEGISINCLDVDFENKTIKIY